MPEIKAPPQSHSNRGFQLHITSPLDPSPNALACYYIRPVI
jgi:hypothetical protein